MSRLKVSIEPINPKPGDIIVAKCYEDEATLWRAKDLWEILSRAFPYNKVIVCPSDFRIKELKPEEFWNFIEQLKKLRPEGEREENNM